MSERNGSYIAMWDCAFASAYARCVIKRSEFSSNPEHTLTAHYFAEECVREHKKLIEKRYDELDAEYTAQENAENGSPGTTPYSNVESVWTAPAQAQELEAEARKDVEQRAEVYRPNRDSDAREERHIEELATAHAEIARLIAHADSLRNIMIRWSVELLAIPDE